ncbi:MAG: sulfur oxidation c-type cytochrome SoxX [Usitatibacter sp.]
MPRFPAVILLAMVLGIPCAMAQSPKPPPDTFTSAEKGNCIACHQLPAGSGPRTRADLGPALEGARMRALGKERIREIIEDPTRANPQTVMPPFGRHHLLDRAQINALVEYLHALP